MTIQNEVMELIIFILKFSFLGFLVYHLIKLINDKIKELYLNLRITPKDALLYLDDLIKLHATKFKLKAKTEMDNVFRNNTLFNTSIKLLAEAIMNDIGSYYKFPIENCISKPSLQNYIELKLVELLLPISNKVRE